ncbi:MAG: GNAT family N-acetyltransferase [Ponticaulis sp.]|nr:GNAT family N-acetyltransferase [Ponticaulis sp.]
MSDIDIRLEETDTGGRYVTVVDGFEAEMTFSKAGTERIIIDHTGVPRELGGRGIGVKLVEQGVLDARAKGLKIVPLCPFAKAQIEKHPEWQDVLA